MLELLTIKVKRKLLMGKGTLSGSFGSRMNRQSLNLTIGKGNFGVAVNGGAHYSWPRIGKTEYKRVDWNLDDSSNTRSILERNGETFSQWIGYRAGMDMFYDINAFQSITSSLSFGGRDKFNNDSTEIEYTGYDPSTSYKYKSFLNSTSVTNQIEFTTDYTKKFANNEDREFSMAIQLSGEFEDDDTKITENNSIITNISDGSGLEKTFQLDYTHPFGSNKKQFSGNSSAEKMQQKSEGRGMHGRKGKGGSSNVSSNKLEIGIKYIDRDKNFIYSTTEHNSFDQ